MTELVKASTLPPQRAVDYLSDGPTRIVGSVLTYIVVGTSFSGTIFEGLSIIFLAVQFYRRNKFVCSAYFYIAFAGYCVDSTASFLYCFTFFFTNWSYVNFISTLVQWYVEFYISPWNIALSFNRFTAIVYFYRQNLIWSTKNIIYVIFLLFLGPFIVSGYSFFNFHCRIVTYDTDCKEYQSTSRIVQTSSNLISCCISSVLTLVSVYHLKPGSKVLSSRSAAFEKRLLIQCAVSTVLFIFHNTFLFLYTATRSHRTDGPMSAFIYVICVNMTNLTFNAYHYLNGVLLIFVSPNIRIPFLHFIGFYRCFSNSRTSPKPPAASASVPPAKT